MMQTLVAECVKSAMSSVHIKLLEAVDRCIAWHTAPRVTPWPNRPHGESGSEVACLPSVNKCH